MYVGFVRFYRYWQPWVHDHFYTTNINEIGTGTAGAWGKYGYISEGTVSMIHTTPVAGSCPLYRYAIHGVEHFYTENANEIGTTTPEQVGNHGYISEGIAGYCFPHQKSGTVPLYRYWQPSTRDHFYTTNANEIGTCTLVAVGKYGYIYEGVVCYVYPCLD